VYVGAFHGIRDRATAQFKIHLVRDPDFLTRHFNKHNVILSKTHKK